MCWHSRALWRLDGATVWSHHLVLSSSLFLACFRILLCEEFEIIFILDILLFSDTLSKHQMLIFLFCRSTELILHLYIFLVRSHLIWIPSMRDDLWTVFLLLALIVGISSILCWSYWWREHLLIMLLELLDDLVVVNLLWQNWIRSIKLFYFCFLQTHIHHFVFKICDVWHALLCINQIHLICLFILVFTACPWIVSNECVGILFCLELFVSLVYFKLMCTCLLLHIFVFKLGFFLSFRFFGKFLFFLSFLVWVFIWTWEWRLMVQEWLELRIELIELILESPLALIVLHL